MVRRSRKGGMARRSRIGGIGGLSGKFLLLALGIYQTAVKKRLDYEMYLSGLVALSICDDGL